jgi:diguanylate cyclase (GGDEF)-like protein
VNPPGPTANPAPQQRNGLVTESALVRTLAMAQARTWSDLIARILEAAVALTGAAAGVAVAADGTRWKAGDERLAGELASADPVTISHTPLADPVNSIVLCATVDHVTVVLINVEPWCVRPDAKITLAMVAAHGQVAADRLREIEMLARRADSDPLTGLRHQRPFEARLGRSLPGRTAVIAFDIDDFKQINDRYGHQAGDEALLALVGALRSALRGDDQLYRIGGDEFAVVMDVKSVAETRSIASRLLDAARGVGHTVSVGAAIHSVGETGRDTLLRADRALYEAKRAGRDTLRIAA